MKILTATLFSLSFILIASLVKANDTQFPVTTSDKAFFQQIKKALLAGDTNWFSGVITYPIVIKTKNESLKMKGKSDFNAHAQLVFNDHFKTIVQNQSSETLFKDWSGLM